MELTKMELSREKSYWFFSYVDNKGEFGRCFIELEGRFFIVKEVEEFILTEHEKKITVMSYKQVSAFEFELNK